MALFYGTRPQVIKASALRRALARVVPVTAIDTGQHYDYALHAVHYDQLGVEPPDAFLGVGSGSHARQTAALLESAAAWVEANRPRLVMVVGDTNSTLACALAAGKLRVPVAHVEAGLRARDTRMAEEINRRCVDGMSQILFAPSGRAAETLRREWPESAVYQVGDVALDVLRYVTASLPSGGSHGQRGGGEPYVYATLHRAELVDRPELLTRVLSALARIERPVVFPIHPRTADVIRRAGLDVPAGIRIREPVGYRENVALVRDAELVVTDSGGVQREAYWLGVPCLTVRAETEWVETVEAGANRLVPPDGVEELAAAGAAMLRRGRGTWVADAYGDGTAAERIAAVVGAV